MNKKENGRLQGFPGPVRSVTCPELASTGHRLVLQVHDELMVEGPEDSAPHALEILRQHVIGAILEK